MTHSLVIPARFCGPPDSGPGGKVLAVARAVWLTVPRPVPALAAQGAL
jgi:hypothetical protein